MSKRDPKDNLTTIITADFLYLILCGDQTTIQNLCDKLNKLERKKREADKLNNNRNKEPYREYISQMIDEPCAMLPENEIVQRILLQDAEETYIKVNGLDELDEDARLNISHKDIEKHKKYIVLDEGVEAAQCFTYGEDYKKCAMLLEVVKEGSYFKVSFPVLPLKEEADPDELISHWIVSHKVSDIATNVTIKPINIVGTTHDILVFAAYIN